MSTNDDAVDFVEFVSARRSTLYRLAYLLTASTPAAEDLLQTSLERSFARWEKVSRMDAPETDVRKIMVNTLISHRRSLSWRREVLRAEAPEMMAEPAQDPVLDHAQLWPLVCTLPLGQRAVIVLRYYEELSEAEAAEILGCAVGTVKSQASDAMRALRCGIAGMRSREIGSSHEPR
jgi:RNA polymerase sigma-70 factor (sigma-E family)